MCSVRKTREVYAILSELVGKERRKSLFCFL